MQPGRTKRVATPTCRERWACNCHNGAGLQDKEIAEARRQRHKSVTELTARSFSDGNARHSRVALFVQFKVGARHGTRMLGIEYHSRPSPAQSFYFLGEVHHTSC